MSARIGEHFGNYRLTRLLGKGGFAETYLGEHAYLKTFAAVKILQAPMTPFDQEAFFTEARTIARLKHPNIIRVLDFGVEHDMPYLVMDYAAGGTLRQRHPRGEPLPLVVVVPYVKQVAAALQYAHQQKIIHRDVKPENMLLGEVDEVLLGDFGVATIVLTTLSPETHNVAGTIAYMAPEQIQGRPQPASDQYALGVVVYEWLTGSVPFQGTYSEVAVQHERKLPLPLRDLCATIPLEVEQVVLKALSKDPRQRFSSVLAFAQELEQISYSSASTLPMAPTLSSSRLPFSGDDPQVYISTEMAARHPAPPEPATLRREKAAPESSKPESSSSAPASNGSSQASPAAAPRLTPPLVPAVQTQSPLQAGDSPAAPARPASTFSTPIMKILVGIIALLFLISIGLTYYALVYRPGQSHPVSSTGTQTPQTLYKQITSRTPDLSDSLNQADNYGWGDSTATDKNGNITYGCSFAQGAYYTFAASGHFGQCTAGATNFSNFAYQVQITIIRGHSGGMTFRCNVNDNGVCYYFRISTDGTYLLEKYIGLGNKNYRYVPITSGTSAAINKGLNQTNTLTVIVRGSTFYLYINGQYVTSASDATYRSGEIGVYTDSDAGAVMAYFHNAQVWKL